MTPLTSTRSNAGFTLVEVMMAIIVMTIGLLGLLQSVNVAYEHNARNRLRDEAVQVAEEQMNEFRSLRFEAITANNATQALAREISGGTRQFQVTRNQTELGDSKRLSVEVGWAFRGVTTQQVIYTIKKKAR